MTRATVFVSFGIVQGTERTMMPRALQQIEVSFGWKTDQMGTQAFVSCLKPLRFRSDSRLALTIKVCQHFHNKLILSEKHAFGSRFSRQYLIQGGAWRAITEDALLLFYTQNCEPFLSSVTCFVWIANRDSGVPSAFESWGDVVTPMTGQIQESYLLPSKQSSWHAFWSAVGKQEGRPKGSLASSVLWRGPLLCGSHLLHCTGCSTGRPVPRHTRQAI